ncbi:MAG: hypothetical protein GF309_06930 [Candidatus Lokiarchaeota archaeon]|nr:hypothetical protein [Candidatus Lokiarchaeota archaeon]
MNVEWVQRMGLVEKTREGILRVIAYLIPLVVQMPGMVSWIGLMSVPLLVFLIAMLGNGPTGIAEAVGFFVLNPLNPMNIAAYLGAIIALASILHLAVQKRKANGLVMSGPYRYVRHPQYLGLLLLTSGFTAWSYWVLIHTFGIGWLSPEGTVALWFVILIAYLGLALIEEKHLAGKFGEEYAVYRDRTGFFIPGVTTPPHDVLASTVLLSLVTVLLLLFARI